jgi:F-type H+-transporting ATPase subunit a
MGDHSTWFHLLPGYQNLESWAQHYLGRGEWPLIGGTYFTLAHVLIAALVAVLLTLGAVSYRRQLATSGTHRLIPEEKFGVRNVFELIIETALSLAEGVMGRAKAERYFPLVGTLIFFILFNNLIGLVPGFLPATDTLKTNVALSVTVFVMTHVYGFKAHGPAYIKHFFGPVWYLAPLMFVIEIISHIARPVSLALRLMGNVAADHKVVSAFFVLVPILVPLPFLVLGILVSVVQTLVFSLLTMVYIDLAVAHEEH